MTGGGRAAVFLDRDGTLIRDVRYLSKAEQVELLPGAAAAVRRVNEAGMPAIIVTNQSGIGRGYFSQADYEQAHARLLDLLKADGARIDAAYMCPHVPEVSGPCECRKPGTLLYRRAAGEHGLDVARSWFIGDRLRDVSPAQELGGSGVLVPSDRTPLAEVERARKDFTVEASLDAAVTRAIESAR